MKKFILSIADLHFKIFVPTAKEYTFLRNKYRHYFVSSSKKIAASIYLHHHTRKTPQASRKSSRVFIVSIASLSQDFDMFNYFLRRVVSVTLLKHNGISLHASSLLEKNGAIIFLGCKGAGKSTMRKLGAPRISLGDDNALIRKIRGTYYLYGSPFYLKTNRSYPPLRRKIVGFCVLQQAPYNLLLSLHFVERVQSLIENAFTFPLMEKIDQNKNIYSISTDISNCVPMAKFSFKKEKNALALLKPFFSPSFQDKHSHAQIIKTMRPKLRLSLTPNLSWSTGIADLSFLQQAHAINDQTWRFEFEKTTLFSDITSQIKQTTIVGTHTQIIKAMAATPISPFKWFVFLKKGPKYVCIDGNHSSTALLLRQKKHLLRILVGQ